MHHRVYVGQVVSDKMEKTIVVAVPWVQRHRRYGKAMRKITKLYVHDPRGECQMGDRVSVEEVRPLSRTKRWLLKGILFRREIVQAPELEEAVGAVVAPGAATEEPAVDEALVAETETAADEAAEAEPVTDEAPEAETETAADEATEAEPVTDEAPEAETAADEAAEAEPVTDEAPEAETETAADEVAEAEPATEEASEVVREEEPQQTVTPPEAGDEQPSPSPGQGEERAP